MNALVMCGGEGSRLRPAVGDTEKPLVEVGGVPMVERVVSAVWGTAAAADGTDDASTPIETVYAAVSPATPETAVRLHADERVHCLETPGEGYVVDLAAALETVEPPVLTVAADLPFLAVDHVVRAEAAGDDGSLTVCVPAATRRRLGLSVESTTTHEGQAVVPSGLNVVADDADRVVVWDDDRLAFNVNRPADLAAARAWVDAD